MSRKNIAISFENVSKMYRLGLVGTGTLGQDLNRWWKMNILHQEDPYLKIGQTNDRSTKGTSDFVYALKDIDFQVDQGDVVGIIGKNGAGKSTLLKLLSRITAPTTGQIKTRGRLASLLEVGTGFHPELTGRENIYMNGSIMGMTKSEITRKLDEIIDFAGVERYIDTPCKRYSSGMQVRLGFAVAAFLEPEILVVDEVLAVGDAEFQKKAIGKMKDVSQGAGRTVLFVSHNMSSVRKLCSSGIVLKNGLVDFTGTANQCVDYYIGENGSEVNACTHFSTVETADPTKNVVFLSVSMENANTSIDPLQDIVFIINIYANKDVDNCRINTTIFGSDDSPIGGVSCTDSFSVRRGCSYKIKYTIKDHHLVQGIYSAAFSVGIGNYTTGQRDFDIVQRAVSFEIISSKVEEQTLQWYRAWGNINFPFSQEVLSKSDNLL